MKLELLIERAFDAGHVAKKVEEASHVGVAAVADLVKRHEERQIGNIANRRIPQSSTGRPLWKRRGANGGILGGLTTTFESRQSATVSIEGAAKRYAARREGLGVDWTPKSPAGGIVRKNTFARDTVRIADPQVQPVFEAAFRAELDKS